MIVRCAQCKECKDESEFYKRRDSKTGYSSACKPCRKENRRILDGYYDKIREKKNATEFTCIVCKITKPLDLEHFGPCKNKINGYTSYCRECIREKNREKAKRKREENVKTLIAEPCCCDRCGMELSEWDATYPDIGTWHDARLCRGCHYETTGVRVRKGTKPSRLKLPQSTVAILKTVRPAIARRSPIPT